MMSRYVAYAGTIMAMSLSIWFGYTHQWAIVAVWSAAGIVMSGVIAMMEYHSLEAVRRHNELLGRLREVTALQDAAAETSLYKNRLRIELLEAALASERAYIDRLRIEALAKGVHLP